MKILLLIVSGAQNDENFLREIFLLLHGEYMAQCIDMNLSLVAECFVSRPMRTMSPFQ